MPWCSWSPVPSISCPLSFSWLTISPALLIMSNVSHWKMNQWWPDAFFNCPSVLESALFNDNEPKHLHKSCKNYLVCYIWRCGTNFDESIVVLRVGKFKLSDRLLGWNLSASKSSWYCRYWFPKSMLNLQRVGITS